MKRIVIAFLIIFCLNCKSYAEVFEHRENLLNIMTKLPAINSTKCKFNQEKQFVGTDTVLLSSGDFVFEKNRGVIFYTKSPVIQTTSYQDRNFRQVGGIINAILNKEYSKLEKEFDFYFESNKNSWQLGLKPKINTKSYSYINSILINGNTKISKIIISAPTFTTKIRFFE